MSQRKKILFIANHRLGRSPGQRFRFEQYLDYLKENGFDWELSNLISEEDDKLLYSRGKIFKKAIIARNSYKKRKTDLSRLNEFDIVFVFREALLTPSIRFEKAFARSKAKFIFDFDDAIWLPNVSTANKSLQKLKKPEKVNAILPLADLIFAGNQYLADYAKKFNPNVKIVPTTIDTDYHKRTKENSSDYVTIGWTGTDTTRRYLYQIENVLEELKEKYGKRIKIKIICDKPWEPEKLKVENIKWKKSEEIEQLESVDIGIMPLTDDEWSRGKCGFKGLQYMAMESVPVLSPVGVNKEIIQQEENGFLAKTSEDWFRTLSLLIENKELRKKLGKAARKTVEDRYSYKALRDDYVNFFKAILQTTERK